jgi:hypothetical protein
MRRPARAATASVIAACLAAPTLAGCSLGSRQAMADRVTRAADGALAAGSLRGTLVLHVQPVKSSRPAPPGAPRVVPIATPPLVVVSDLRGSRTAIGPDPAAPTLLFLGAVVYERRGSLPPNVLALGPAAASNLFVLALAASEGPLIPGAPPLPPTQPSKVKGRPWLKLDYDALARTSQEKTASTLGIDPGRLVRLLRGALAGSLRLAGTEDVGGVPTSHYTMNVSREKAGRGRSDDERILLQKEFDANAVEGDVSKAEAWVDAEGRLRRVLVRLRQRLDSTTATDLDIAIDVAEVGQPVQIEAPAKRDVATVASLGQLVHAATGA